MHCDLRKAPVQAHCRQPSLQLLQQNSKLQALTPDGDLFKRREWLRALLHLTVTVNNEPDGTSEKLHQLGTTFEEALSPSQNGLSAAQTRALVRSVLCRPPNEPSTTKSISFEPVVDKLLKTFRLSPEAQLVLELALISNGVEHNTPSRLQSKITSLLDSSESWLKNIPVDLLESVVSVVDQNLKDRIRKAVSEKLDSDQRDCLPLSCLLLNSSGQDFEAVDPEVLDQLISSNLDGPPMEASSAEKLVRDVGRALTSSPEKCESYIRDLGKATNLQGSILIARIIGAMCKSHLSPSNDDSVWMTPSNVHTSAGWPNQKEVSPASQQEALEWNVDIFFRAIKAIEPTLDWKDVVRSLDHKEFAILDRAGLRFLWQIFGKAFETTQNIPMNLIYNKWNNLEAQFHLLKQIINHPDIVKLSECNPCTKPEQAADKNGAQGAPTTEEDPANLLATNWKVLEVHEALLAIGERQEISKFVSELYKQAMAAEGCQESLVLCLLQLRGPIGPLRRSLIHQLITTYLGSPAHNAQSILHYGWNGCPANQAEIQVIIKDAMVDYYTSSDGETPRLTRILELAQEIKCLQALLAIPRQTEPTTNQAPILLFAIDLACLASRREYLKLDKWMQDNMNPNSEPFMRACLHFLVKRVPYLSNPNENVVNHLVTTDCVHTMLSTLMSFTSEEKNKHRCAEIMEQVLKFMENFKLFMQRVQNQNGSSVVPVQAAPFPPVHLPPGHLPQPAQPPTAAVHNIGELGFRGATIPFPAAGPLLNKPFPAGVPMAPLIVAPMGIPNAVPAANDDYMQSGDISSFHVTKETEEEANMYFQRIYNQPGLHTDTIQKFLEMLKKFSTSSLANERDVFTCMIKNLFEEYRFFPSYPDKELTITAHLFGGIINNELVHGATLKTAHAYILEALKNPKNVKMFYFGIIALDCFKDKLKNNSGFCQLLLGQATVVMFPPHLQTWIECGLNSQEPPNRPQGQLPTLSNGKLTTSAVAPAKKGTPPAMPATRKSIASVANIDILLGASDKIEKVSQPSENIQDKVGFIINNLSQANVIQKSEEFRDLIGEDLFPWFAHYMVVNRASMEPNFHSLYVNFLDNINSRTLHTYVLAETYRNIHVLLRSDKSASSYSDRSLLKSLGHWLGLLTLARNRPIMATDIDLKNLLIEAYHKGQSDLLYVVPFIAKVLESAVKSTVFKPPSPYTMGLVYGLAELHDIQNLKLNLRFEVEVLCKALQLNLQNVKQEAERRGCYSILKDPSRLSHIDNPLLGAPAAHNNNNNVPALQQAPMPSGQAMNHVQAKPGAKAAPDIMPMIQQFNQLNMSTGANGLQQQLSINAPPQSMVSNPAGPNNMQNPAMMAPAIPPPVSHYSLRDFNSVTLATFPGLVQVPQCQLFQTYPMLKSQVAPAVERSVQMYLAPAIERALKITLATCENIIKKDFALDPDENRMRLAAHNMVRSVMSGMVHISCREALSCAISGNAKTFFIATLRSANSASSLPPPLQEAIETAAKEVAVLNAELACCFVQKSAIDKAILDSDKKLFPEYEARKAARRDNTLWCDKNALNLQERMPEQLRIKVGPTPQAQMAVYEEFARNIPGFVSAGDQRYQHEDFFTQFPGQQTQQHKMQQNSTGHGSAASQAPGHHQGPPTSLGSNQASQAAPSQLMISRSGLDEPVFEKVKLELDMLGTAISNLMPTQHLSQVMQLMSNVKEALHTFRLQNEQSAFHLVHKTTETLIEGSYYLVVEQQHELSGKLKEMIGSILSTASERHILGHKAATVIAKSYIENHNDEARMYIPTIDFLIRSNLISPVLDSFLIQLYEQSVSLNAVDFMRDFTRLLEMIRDSGHLSNASLSRSVDHILRRMGPPQPPLSQQQINSNLLGDEFGVTPPELLMGQRGTLGGAANLEYSSPPIAMMHSGMSDARNQDDPPGLQEKTDTLLRDWVLRFSTSQGKDSTQAFQQFVAQMNSHGILKTDDLITKFFRLATEMCVDHTYRQTTHANGQIQTQAAIATNQQQQQPQGPQDRDAVSLISAQNSSAVQAHQLASVTRNKCYMFLDAYVRLIALLVKLSGDQASSQTKVNLLNKVLGIIAGVLVQDHETRNSEFLPMTYHRIFLMLFLELTAPEPVLEAFCYQTLVAFCNTFHALTPSKVPGFAFVWLELISHRVFLARMLAITPQQKCWGMFAQLLQDLFKFLAPYLRNMELTAPVQLLYKGTLRVLLVLLHDFPEFLVDYHYGFCDIIPANCVQMRNLILSAFPRHMRLPDPFTPNLRVGTLQDCNNNPRILPDFVMVIQISLRKSIDSFLKSRQPASAVSDLVEALKSSPIEPGSKYNVPLINAVVLYVGTQAIAHMQQQNHQQQQQQPPYQFVGDGNRPQPKGQQGPVSMTWQGVSATPHFEMFEKLVAELDREGRYLVLNAIANQLRFPNSHTAYFSALILALFANVDRTETTEEISGSNNFSTENHLREQITRVLLERLIVNRPHPWGLLVTFVDLLKNQQLNLWKYDFIRCAPEIEKLFDSVARSCVGKPAGLE